MLLPIAAFVIVTAVLYGVGRLLMRGGRKAAGVFNGERRRPLMFGPLTAALAGILPWSENRKAKVKKELRQAGYYHRMAFEEFAALRNAMVVGWVLFVAAAMVVLADQPESFKLKVLAGGIAGALLLFGMPRLVLHSQADGRVRRIEYGLPDALDMVGMCMAGGLPLEHAVTRVGNELENTHGDLASEFRILGRQTETNCLDYALDQFADRVGTAEVQSLAALVSQTGKLGGSVAGAFQGFADEVRRTRRQRAEEHGNKTSVKMLFPIVFFLAPPIYMLLLTPAVMELRDFIGRENGPGGILVPAAAVATQYDRTKKGTRSPLTDRKARSTKSNEPVGSE
jgi:tight adherence protein C